MLLKSLDEIINQLSRPHLANSILPDQLQMTSIKCVLKFNLLSAECAKRVAIRFFNLI